MSFISHLYHNSYRDFQLPINRLVCPVINRSHDGQCRHRITQSTVNYWPNRQGFGQPVPGSKGGYVESAAILSVHKRFLFFLQGTCRMLLESSNAFVHPSSKSISTRLNCFPIRSYPTRRVTLMIRFMRLDQSLERHRFRSSQTGCDSCRRHCSKETRWPESRTHQRCSCHRRITLRGNLLSLPVYCHPNRRWF